MLILFHLLMLMKLGKLGCNEKRNQLLKSNVYFRSMVDLLELCDLYVPCGRGKVQFLSIFQVVLRLSLCVFVYFFDSLNNSLLSEKTIYINLAARKIVLCLTMFYLFQSVQKANLGELIQKFLRRGIMVRIF